MMEATQFASFTSQHHLIQVAVSLFIIIRQWFGDGLYWGGCVLIALLGQRERYVFKKLLPKFVHVVVTHSLLHSSPPSPWHSFEANDFSYHIIKAYQLDLVKEAALGTQHAAKVDSQLAVVRCRRLREGEE